MRSRRVIIPLSLIIIAALVGVLSYSMPWDPYNGAKMSADAVVAVILICGVVLLAPITMLEFIPGQSHIALGRIFRATACLMLIPLWYMAFSDHWGMGRYYELGTNSSLQITLRELWDTVIHNVNITTVALLVTVALFWKRGGKSDFVTELENTQTTSPKQA